MANKFFAVFLVAAFFAAVSAGVEDTKAPTKLKFSFYITSMCRDTQNFITKQLASTYKELKDSLDVEFIPWGKSKRNTDGSITCQFGNSDCQANKIQTCALSELKADQAKQVEYIDCEMTSKAAVSLDYSCVKSVGLTEASVKACFSSAEGDRLQKLDEDKTKTITMIFVPTIVQDNVYNAQIQNAAFSNFRGYVCGLLQKDDPTACK